MKKEWITNLKVGDKVIIYKQYTHTPIAFTVSRLTKTQIIVSDGRNAGDNSVRERRFRKADGRGVGASGFDTSYIHESTPELIEQAEKCKLQYYLTNFCSWKKVPLEKLRQIKALLAAPPVKIIKASRPCGICGEKAVVAITEAKETDLFHWRCGECGAESGYEDYEKAAYEETGKTFTNGVRDKKEGT